MAFFAAENFKEEQYLRETTPKIVVTEKQIEVLARRLLPEIKRYFGNEEVQKDFEQWERRQQEQQNQQAA